MALLRICSGALRSPALAVALLIAIAVLAAVGTVTSPPGSGEVAGRGPFARAVGLERTFSSPLFLAVVSAAALNVAFCSWHRLAPRLRTRKGGWRAATDLALHGSLLLILAGGVVKGALGFTGTRNVYVGEDMDTVYDWRSMGDAPLGFRLRIEEFQERHYPVRARIGLSRADTGEKVALLEVVEGQGEVKSPDGSLRLRIAGFDPEGASIRLEVTSSTGGAEHVLSTREGDGAAVRAGSYQLALVAYRADLRQVRARVALEGPGAPPQEEWLTTNDRVRRGDASVFLTAWGRDDAGRRFCGIQVVRDPGGPVFWAGCILLALAAPAHLLTKIGGAESAQTARRG